MRGAVLALKLLVQPTGTVEAGVGRVHLTDPLVLVSSSADTDKSTVGMIARAAYRAAPRLRLSARTLLKEKTNVNAGTGASVTVTAHLVKACPADGRPIADIVFLLPVGLRDDRRVTREPARVH